MAGKITLLDGATGTSLWEKASEQVPVWRYNLEQPKIVSEVHKEYIAAGSQIIYTNTFSVNAGSIKGYDHTVEEVVAAGVRIAKEAAAGTDVKVALDVGPLTVLLEPYGDLEEDECEEIYEQIIRAGMAEEPDCIVLETFMDVEMLRIAATVAKRYDVPVFCTMTFEKKGRTMMGNRIEDIVEVLEEVGVDAVGMNCSLGPEAAIPIIEEFAQYTKLPLIFKPNAGLPVQNEDGTESAPYSAKDFAEDVKPVLGKIAYVGGCCGSSPEYIRELKKIVG
jgi:5-methyltetrahydrofolate--homocysteine methyltransferase